MKLFAYMPRLRILATAALALLAAAPCARSVVVAWDNSSTYTQAPTGAGNDFGFGNFAVVSNYIAGIPASGIYIGNGWILTAYHNLSDGGAGFQIGSISIQGVNYTGDSSTFTRLHNPDTSLTDLAMFRLTTVPAGLPTLTLSGTSPTLQTSVRMMGNGVDRELTETHWNSSWQQVGSTSTYNGYKWAGTRTVRWGTNTVEGIPSGLIGQADDPYGRFMGFYTDFDRVSGEAQATDGDSGGGVFQKQGSTWELAGIMLRIATYPTQPAGTVVYNDQTYAADLSVYKSEIESIRALPEPSTAIFSITGLAIALQRRRRGLEK